MMSESRIDENRLFREVAGRICGSLDIGLALWHSLVFLKDYMPLDWITMGLYEPELGAIRYVARATARKGSNEEVIISMPDDARGHLEQMDYPEVMIVGDPADDPVCQAVAGFYNEMNSSVLMMSLIIGRNQLGTLALRAEGKNRYRDRHARLLSPLGILFAMALSNALRYREVIKLQELLADDNRFLNDELIQLSGGEVIGEEQGLKEVMQMVHQVAPLDSPVLIMGETGVGKEVIANAIKNLSLRNEGPFIKVNCGAIPENLYDSELFGHERGAFTGATALKRGRFERAHNGTIFLDEIGDLPLLAQVRLLRVIQNREIERVGGTRSIPVNVRIITATHHNLENMVARGEFREDLWYRLNIFPITIPPLRQRTEDIPALVDYLIRQKSKALNLRTIPALSRGALSYLTSHPWKGNVRELENMIERALIQHRKGPLVFKPFLKVKPQYEPAGLSLKDDGVYSLDRLLTSHIQQVLKITEGKINGPRGAAELLCLHPNTLRKKMDKLGIPYRRRDLPETGRGWGGRRRSAAGSD